MSAAAVNEGEPADLARARAAAATVCDPEIPVLSIADLGVLRDVGIGEDGRVRVTITPTYSGCPAMLTIKLELIRALAEAGFDDPLIETELAPAWSTDALTERGRRKLIEYGIAPPTRRSTSKLALFGADEVQCPRCGSARTERVSEFGSTACKALYRCKDCAEPFDYFKCI